MPQAVFPVIAAHVEDLGRSLPQMDLDTVPIEFDLVNPASDGWQLLDRGRQCKLTFRGRAPYPDRDETAGRLRRSDAAVTSRCLACNEPVRWPRIPTRPAGCLLFFGGVRYVALSRF